ncbi:MAG: SpaA isopeptide-forming pilin-related protein [Oscillospiraceae bacterium]|nr:SpaA isopeptide-forming pilin-related protein [Oscillospiraceae bacterium]
MENSSRLERLRNRIRKHNRKIFATLASIGLIAGVLFVYFTIQNAKTIDGNESGSGFSSDLAEFITDVTVTDSLGNPISAYHLGNHYIFNIAFAESEFPRFQFEYNDDGVLIYNLPEGMKIPAPSANKPIYSEERVLIGTYSIKTDDDGATWYIETKFYDIQNDGSPTPDGENFIDYYVNVEFLVSIEAEFMGSPGTKQLKFGENITLEFEVERLNAGITNTKKGDYNSATKKATYKSVIKALGTNETELYDIVFTDTANDQTGTAVPGTKYENIQYKGPSDSAFVPINPAYLTILPEGGFKYEFPGIVLGPNETIEVTYEINADYLEAKYVGANGVPAPAGGTPAGTISGTLFSISNKAWVSAMAEETPVESSATASVDYSTWMKKTPYSNSMANYTTLPDGRIMWTLNIWDVPLAGKTITDVLGQYPNQKYYGDIELSIANGVVINKEEGGVSLKYNNNPITVKIPSEGLGGSFSYTFDQTYNDGWYARQGFPEMDENWAPNVCSITYYTQVDFDNYIPSGFYGNDLHIGTIPYLTQKTYIKDTNTNKDKMYKENGYVEIDGKDYIEYTVTGSLSGEYGGVQSIGIFDKLERHVTTSATKDNSKAQSISHEQTRDFHIVIKNAADGTVLLDFTQPGVLPASQGATEFTKATAQQVALPGVLAGYSYKVYLNTNNALQFSINTYSNATPAVMWPFSCDVDIEVTYLVPFTAPTIGTASNTTGYYATTMKGVATKNTAGEVAEAWVDGKYTDRVYNNSYIYSHTSGGTIIYAEDNFNHSNPITKNMTTKSGNVAAFSIVVNQDSKQYAIGETTYNIVDTMSSNLGILMDTLKVYEISGGKWVDRTSLLDVDPSWGVNFAKLFETGETQIIFTVPDGVPIKVEYDTYVHGTAGEEDRVYNRVDIAGISSLSFEDVFLVTQSGAYVGGKRMTVTMTKFDEEVENLLLSGAEFALYMNALPDGSDHDEIIIEGETFYRIESKVSGEAGKIEFNNQDLTSHIKKIFALVEISPPEGYQKDGDGITLFSFNSDDDFHGRPVIWIHNSIGIGNKLGPPEPDEPDVTTEPEPEIPVPLPQPVKVYKADVDEKEILLAGAEFELYVSLETNDAYEGYELMTGCPEPVLAGGRIFYYVQTKTTGTDGIATFDSDLIAPEYKAVYLIREIDAPEGYILPTNQNEKDKYFVIHIMSEEEEEQLDFELNGREFEFVSEGFYVYNKLEPVIEPHDRILPETGSKGIIWIVSSVIILIFAAFAVVIRRGGSNGKG